MPRIEGHTSSEKSGTILLKYFGNKQYFVNCIKTILRIILFTIFCSIFRQKFMC